MALGELTVAGSWLGVLAFTFQIYFDFSGYSDMAIGLGRMLGREVVEMDQRIAAQEGMSIPELFAQKGEPTSGPARQRC